MHHRWPLPHYACWTMAFWGTKVECYLRPTKGRKNIITHFSGNKSRLPIRHVAPLDAAIRRLRPGRQTSLIATHSELRSNSSHDVSSEWRRFAGNKTLSAERSNGSETSGQGQMDRLIRDGEWAHFLVEPHTPEHPVSNTHWWGGVCQALEQSNPSKTQFTQHLVQVFIWREEI